MTFARQTLLAASLLVCADSGAPGGEDTSTIVSEEAAAVIEQTPCPEAGDVSVEECLLWLTPDAPQAFELLLNSGETGSAPVGVNGGDPVETDDREP